MSSEYWNNDKDQTMEDLVTIKAKNPKVRALLLSPGKKELIEATGDTYWACGATFCYKKGQENKTTGKETR